MVNDPDYDKPHRPASRLAATAAAGNRSTTASPGPVTLFVRRLGWEMCPVVHLRYDADEDLLLARFVPAVTSDSHTVDDRLFVGFDDAGPDARCTTVCLAGLTMDPSGLASQMARRILGEAVWAAAGVLAANGSGDRNVLLESGDVTSLLAAWSTFKEPLAPPVRSHPSDIASAGQGQGIAAFDRRAAVRRRSAAGGVKVDVISVSDAEIAEMLELWSVEFSRAEHSRGPGARGLLHYALQRGISSLRPTRDRNAGQPDGIFSGEWDLPDLVRIGVHSRVAWQIEPGDPPVLVVKAARIDPLGAGRADIEHRIEVRFGDRRGHGRSVAADAIGRLAARGRVPFSSTKRRGRRMLLRSVRGVGHAVPRWRRKGHSG